MLHENDWICEGRDVGERLDKFLMPKLVGLSRVKLQVAIHEGLVMLNGHATKPSQQLHAGDQITVRIPDPIVGGESPDAEAMALDILYEDESLLVVNKPAGLVVHPGAGNSHGTLVNALLHHCKSISGVGGPGRPGIVHRLDKETSGCIVVAKSDTIHSALAAQFASRLTEKAYLALVVGVPRMPHGTIDGAIGRHPIHRQKMAVVERGRASLTTYRVLASEGTQALVECHPKTGRTHQIRVHLKHLGHPVVGDPVYGRRGAFSRHFLHAWKLAFSHPATNAKVSFTAPLPPDFPEWARVALPAIKPPPTRFRAARQ